MILCSGRDEICVCVCVCVRERVETQGVYTENTQVEMYIHKGERLNYLQGGRRVLLSMGQECNKK